MLRTLVVTAIAAGLAVSPASADKGGKGKGKDKDRDAVVTECRALSEQITREAEQLKLNPSNPALIGLLTATDGATPLRACAGEKIAEAESLAKAPR